MKEERKEPIQIPHIQTINDHISYLTPTEHPLSANVVIIEGDAFLWGYDVGNHPAVPEILQTASGFWSLAQRGCGKQPPRVLYGDRVHRPVHRDAD